MPGLDTSIVVHRLPLIDGWKLIKEKLKRMRLDILIKVKEELKKQWDVGFLEMVKYPQRWWENTKSFFFLRPNSRGQPAQVKISQRWKIFKSNFKLGHFKVAFHLMDLVRDFSYEVCKTRCPMSQSLDDMHASLPDLKYRPQFLLNLLICLIDEDLLSLIWVIFVI